MKKMLMSLVAIAMVSSISHANEYWLGGNSMECRINSSNGIPAVVMDTGIEKFLKMSFQTGSSTLEAYYDPAEANRINFSYNDSVKLNNFQMPIDLYDLKKVGVKLTGSTIFTLAGEKTVIICNIREANTGPVIPASPKIN